MPTGSPSSPTRPSPTGRATSCASSRAGCAAPTWRSSSLHVGAVLGHEVVAELEDGRRVALVHHASCGECERCLAGHESTCERFTAPTIRPGGFAERVRAQGWVDLPPDWPDWRGTMVEPLACVLRGVERVPRGRVLIVGNGFVGRLFGPCWSVAATTCSRSTSTHVAPVASPTARSMRPSSAGEVESTRRSRRSRPEARCWSSPTQAPYPPPRSTAGS